MVAKSKKGRSALAQEIGAIKKKKGKTAESKEAKASGGGGGKKPKSKSAAKSKQQSKAGGGAAKLKAKKQVVEELKVLNELVSGGDAAAAKKKKHAFKYGTRAWQRIQAYNTRLKREPVLSVAAVTRELSDAVKRVDSTFDARVGEGTIDAILQYLDQELTELMRLARFSSQHGRPHLPGGTKAKNQPGTMECAMARLKDRGKELPENNVHSVTFYRDPHQLTALDVAHADIIMENGGRL